MPKIEINPKEIMTNIYHLDHLIWQIIHKANPEKAFPTWYADGGIHDKIKELWELIK